MNASFDTRPEIQTEPRWKRIARNLFFLFIIASAVPLALAAYFEIQAHKGGTKQPTAENTIEFTQHAVKKYISPAESERIRLMWTIFLITFPSAVLSGLILRFIFKVDILKDEPKPVWVDNLMNDLKKR
jgi:hypothetical protein